MVFFTMLFVVGLSLLSWVTSFRLWFSNDYEAIVFKLSDLLLSEGTNFGFGVRAVVILLLLFLNWIFLSVFGFVLTFFTILVPLSARSLITSPSSFSVVSLLVVISFTSWLNILNWLGRFSKRSRFNFNSDNSGSLFNFLCNCNWSRNSLNFSFRLRSAYNDRGLNDNWNNNNFFFNFFDGFWLHFNFLIQNITDNLFLVAH